MKNFWIFGTALAALSACGPLQSGNPLAGIVPGVAGAESVVAAPSLSVASLTREQIEAQPVDLMVVSLIDRETTALISRVMDNAGKVTWLSPDGLSLVFKEGLLIGTRGFGDDLMGSDVDGAIASLNGGGNHLRTLEFMNGLDQIEQIPFTCVTQQVGTEDITIFDRTYATAKLEETCSSDIGEFINTYWCDAHGVIWQSRQLISVDVGYLGYQRL